MSSDLVNDVIADVLRQANIAPVQPLSPVTTNSEHHPLETPIQEEPEHKPVDMMSKHPEPADPQSEVSSDTISDSPAPADAAPDSLEQTSSLDVDVQTRLRGENAELQRWITCFVVVNFEIEYGQVVDQVYPSDVSLTPSERSILSFLAFPDSNATTLGDTQYTFHTPLLTSLSAGPLYGFVYFRQQKDQSQKRGFLQKSLVLLSPLSYVALFEASLRAIGPLFFEHGASILEVAAHNIAAWPAPSPGASLELPLLGSVLITTLPGRYLNDAMESTAHALATRAGAVGSPSHPRTLGMPAPVKGFHVTIVVDGCNCENAYPLQEVNLYEAFQTRLSDLWMLWELVLTNQPLLVISPTPNLCSRAVLALASLIAPIPYSGDLRPYFTVHDPDFKDFSAPPAPYAKHSSKAAIVGVTNPFFLKALCHWPHVIPIGDTAKLTTLSPSKPLQSPTKPPEELELKYKPFLPRPTKFLKRLLKPAGDQKQISTINNLMLRQHFVDRTEQFLRPLEIFFHSYMDKLSREISPLHPPPSVQFFPEDEFVKFLQSYQGPAAIKSKAEIELYRRFIRSPNFRPWFDIRWTNASQRLQALFRNALCCMDSYAVARSLPKETAESTLTDVCLRLQQELQRERRKPDPARDVILTLRAHLAELLGLLPPELQQTINEVQ